MKKVDRISDEEYNRNCAHYPDWGLFAPPDRFIFYYYDNPSQQFICERPMAGIERYVVTGINGGHYGIYDSRDVGKYLLTREWVQIKDHGFFIVGDIAELERKLKEMREELISSRGAGNAKDAD